MAGKSGYKSSQPRDKNGRWTSGGSMGSGSKTPSRGGSGSTSGTSSSARPETKASRGLSQAQKTKLVHAQRAVKRMKEGDLPFYKKKRAEAKSRMDAEYKKFLSSGNKDRTALGKAELEYRLMGQELISINNSIAKNEATIKRISGK